MEDVTLPKVVALARKIVQMCDMDNGKQWVHPINGRIEDILDSHMEVMCFSAFDSVPARRAMFDKWVEKVSKSRAAMKKGIFIDGRLSAESFHVYAVRPSESDIEAYRKTLWAADEVQEEVCSYKSTTHMSVAIAARMVELYNNHLTNLKIGAAIRSVPGYMFHEAVLLTSEG
jgi:hypothetical protein